MKKLIAILAVAFTAIIISSTSVEAKVVDVYFGKDNGHCQIEKKGADMRYGKNGVVAKFDTKTMKIVKSYYSEAKVGQVLTVKSFGGKLRKELEAAEKAAEEAKISPADKKRMKNFKNLKITIKRSRVGTKPQVTVIDKKTGKKVTEGVYYSDRLEDYKTVAVDNDKYLGEREVKWVTYCDASKFNEKAKGHYCTKSDIKVYPYTGTEVIPWVYDNGTPEKVVNDAIWYFKDSKGKIVKKAIKPGKYKAYWKAKPNGCLTGKSKKPVATFEIKTWKQIDKMKKYNFKWKPGTKAFEKNFLKRWNKVKTIAPFSDGWGTERLETCYPTYKYTKKSRMLWYAWDCNSYAMGVCELIFGKRYNDENVKESKQIKDIGVGSCMVVNHGTHIEIVLGIKKNGLLLTAEGNLSGFVNIDDTVAKAKGWQNPTTVKDMYRTFYAWK